MKGCDDALAPEWAVTLLVPLTYRVRADDETTARTRALARYQVGQQAEVRGWPADMTAARLPSKELTPEEAT